MSGSAPTPHFGSVGAVLASSHVSLKEYVTNAYAHTCAHMSTQKSAHIPQGTGQTFTAKCVLKV